MESDISTSFLHIDSFRDVASWFAAKRAEERPEGQEIMSAFKQANTCSANALYHGGGTVGLTDLHIKKRQVRRGKRGTKAWRRLRRIRELLPALGSASTPVLRCDDGASSRKWSGSGVSVRLRHV